MAVGSKEGPDVQATERMDLSSTRPGDLFITEDRWRRTGLVFVRRRFYKAARGSGPKWRFHHCEHEVGPVTLSEAERLIATDEAHKTMLADLMTFEAGVSA